MTKDTFVPSGTVAPVSDTPSPSVAPADESASASVNTNQTVQDTVVPSGKPEGENTDTAAAAAKPEEGTGSEEGQAKNEDGTGAEGGKPEGEPQKKNVSEDLVKQLSALRSTLQQTPGQGDPGNQEAMNRIAAIDAEINALGTKVQNGEIGDDHRMQELNALITEKTQLGMRIELDNRARAEGERSDQEAFVRAYPDFIDFAHSDTAKGIVDSNTVMNPVSAYFAVKHAEAVQENESLKTNIASLQKQIADSIAAAGKTQGGLVAGKQTVSQSAQPTQQVVPTKENVNNRMLAALKRVQSQG